MIWWMVSQGKELLSSIYFDVVLVKFCLCLAVVFAWLAFLVFPVLVLYILLVNSFTDIYIYGRCSYERYLLP